MQTPLLTTEVQVKEPEVNQLIENPEKSTGKATLFGSIFNIANNVLGAGFLSLPWAFKHSSVFPGAVLMLLIAVLSGYSFIILAYCCEKTGLFVYRDMGKVALGEKFGILLQAVCVCYTFGACTSYIVMLGDFLPSVLETIHAPTILTNRTLLVSLAVILIIFPLTLLKNLDALKFTSFVGVLLIIYTTFVILYRDDFFYIISKSTQLFKLTDCIVLSIPASCVAFTAHYNGPRYYQELKNRNINQFQIATISGLGICFFCYCTAAVAGYFNFGSETSGNILNNYSSKDVVAMVAKAGFTFTLVFHYPLVFHNLRTSIHKLIFPNREDTPFVRILYSFALLGLLCILGLYFTHVETVISYNGAIFGSNIVFTFPGLLYLMLHKGEEKNCHYCGSIFLIAFGIISMIGGTVFTSLKNFNCLDGCD